MCLLGGYEFTNFRLMSQFFGLFESANFSLCFLFQGITFFELISLLCFKHIVYSFINCLVGVPICVRVFANEICDFVTFFISMNAFDNWFAGFCK